MAVEEKTYAKADIMRALSYLQTPTDEEVQYCQEMGYGRSMNDAEHVRFALVGAEALADALFSGLDATKARDGMLTALGKECVKSICKSVLGSLS